MYKKGKQYRVIRAGAWLSGLKPVGPSSWQGTRKDLNVGDVVVSDGARMGWGSDNIEISNFTFEGFRGEFEPNSWGTPVTGYLTEVEGSDTDA